MENLLANEMLIVLKDAMEIGRISRQEALTTINNFRINQRQFIEDTLGMPYETALERRTEAWNRIRTAEMKEEKNRSTGR